MRILFFTWRWVLRRFVDVVVELEGAGHEVVIAFARNQKRPLPDELRGLAGVRRAVYDDVADPELGRAVALLRHTRDYLWYMGPEQTVGSHNRRRALGYLVASASGGARTPAPSWSDPVVPLDDATRESLASSLDALERSLPADPGVVEFLRREHPDAVLVSPLVQQKLHQTEVLKAARELGIPSGFLVYSLDNLSNKGRIHVPPDRTFVWNELQAREAQELHSIDPASIVVTGAARWDEFLERRPSLDRAAFCLERGFDPSAPTVLYVASSVGICPDETLVVDRWLEALRGSPGPARTANVLIRPHPGTRKYGTLWSGWATVHERVAVTRNPRPADQGLYDSLFNCDAVVGMNTSAQIEASMLGKPVYTFAAGDLAPGQEGTRHFYYLLSGKDGFVSFEPTLAEHVAALERGLAGDFDREAIGRFCERCVRPHGIDRPVAPLLAAEIAQLGAGSSSRQRLGAR